MSNTRINPEQHANQPSTHPVWPLYLGLVGVTLAAGLIRFYRLADLPPGFHYDEAFNGLDVTALLSKPLHQWPIFFTGNFGREPLFNYLLALAQRLFGPSAVTLRGVAAAVGTLLTPALAWLGWEAAPALGCERRRLAPWTGAAVLGLLWSQVFARYALRIEFFSLLATFCMAALWRGWRTGRLRWFGLAGVLAGLAFYTYLPVRLLPAVFVPAGVLVLWRYRPITLARRQGLLLAVLLAAAVTTPLALYFVRNPAEFWQRIGQVSQLTDKDALLRNLVSVLGMFVGVGDANPRNNLPGRPLLDWLAAILFLVGLLHLVRRIKHPGPLLILTWFGVMLAPTVLSDYAPSFQRAIGALPAVSLIIAVGLDRLVAWLTVRFSRYRAWWEAGGWVVLAASVVIMWQAFMAWSTSPELFYARDVGFVALAKSLAAEHAGETVYLSPRGNDHPTIGYAFIETSGAPTPALRGFDGRTCVRIAEAAPANYVLLVNEDTRGLALLQTYLPDSLSHILVDDPTGRPWAIEVVQSAADRVQYPEMHALPVTFQDGVQFLGYWLSDDPVRPSTRLYVRLFWRSIERPSQDYTVFAHLLRIMPDGSETVVAGSDAQPGRGSCRTSDWRPGETIIDELEIMLPADLGAASTYLELGMYDLASGVRLAVPGVSENRILIGPVATVP